MTNSIRSPLPYSKLSALQMAVTASRECADVFRLALESVFNANMLSQSAEDTTYSCD